MALVFSPFSFGLDRGLSAAPRPSLFASDLPFRSMQRAIMPIFHLPFDDDLEESVFGHRSVFDVLEAPFRRRHKRTAASSRMEDDLLRIGNTPRHTVTKRVRYHRGHDGKVVSETITNVKNGNEPAKRTVRRRIGDRVDVETFIEAPNREDQQKLTNSRQQQDDFDAEWHEVTEGRSMFGARARQLTPAHPSTSSDGKADLQDDGKADASPKAKAPKHTYFDVEDWEEEGVEGQASGHEEEVRAEGTVEAGQAGKDKKGDKETSPRGERSLSMMERLQERSRESSPILSDAGDE